MLNQQKKIKKRFVTGLRPLLCLSNYLYANKFATTIPTDPVALRADKTQQKIAPLHSAKQKTLRFTKSHSADY